jgi:hypothetical protein
VVHVNEWAVRYIVRHDQNHLKSCDDKLVYLVSQIQEHVPSIMEYYISSHLLRCSAPWIYIRRIARLHMIHESKRIARGGEPGLKHPHTRMTW